MAAEHLLRQPAGAAAAILPDILQDVGHLQALGEGDGELRACPRAAVDGGRIGAEKFGEHLAHHAGDVVAIVVQVAHARQPARLAVL